MKSALECNPQRFCEFWSYIPIAFDTGSDATEEAFAGVSEFWDKDLEYFEALTTAESQLILADNHHFENNDLFVIDE